MLTRDENGKQCMGNNNFYVTVVDSVGQPLNGIVVHQLWDGATPKDIRDNITGPPFNPPGKVTIAHGAGVYWLTVVGDASGRAYTSQPADQLITDYPPDDWKRASGYCSVDPGRCENCFGHYSYEVVFQRTW